MTLRSFCARSKQDRKLVTEAVNDTKLASLSVASGPGRFFGEEKRPGTICSRMREKLSITKYGST